MASSSLERSLPASAALIAASSLVRLASLNEMSPDRVTAGAELVPPEAAADVPPPAAPVLLQAAAPRASSSAVPTTASFLDLVLLELSADGMVVVLSIGFQARRSEHPARIVCANN